MQLNTIARGFLLAGLFTSFSLPLIAAEAPKGDVKITGNAEKLNELLGYMDKFEFWFNIVTP